ncbi:MAG: hypothetical protein O7C67_09215 [Gammaproteobacteria bacterium]|nr:hypothetical protein [Gammaproteobacteria bacterium]
MNDTIQHRVPVDQASVGVLFRKGRVLRNTSSNSLGRLRWRTFENLAQTPVVAFSHRIGEWRLPAHLASTGMSWGLLLGFVTTDT